MIRSWEREGERVRRRGRRRGERCPRVDPIGAPNLGIRICPLICGFHRNCLSTRRLATGTSHIHLLYATRSTSGKTRVYPRFLACFRHAKPPFARRLSPVGNRIHVPPLFFPASWRTLPSSGFLLPAIVPVAPSSTTSDPIVFAQISLSRAFRPPSISRHGG